MLPVWLPNIKEPSLTVLTLSPPKSFSLPKLPPISALTPYSWQFELCHLLSFIFPRNCGCTLSPPLLVFYSSFPLTGVLSWFYLYFLPWIGSYSLLAFLSSTKKWNYMRSCFSNHSSLVVSTLLTPLSKASIDSRLVRLPRLITAYNQLHLVPILCSTFTLIMLIPCVVYAVGMPRWQQFSIQEKQIQQHKCLTCGKDNAIRTIICWCRAAEFLGKWHYALVLSWVMTMMLISHLTLSNTGNV